MTSWFVSGSFFGLVFGSLVALAVLGAIAVAVSVGFLVFLRFVVKR